MAGNDAPGDFSKESRICIIGCGISGMAAAHHLSGVAGTRITILEAHEQLGGRANITEDGEHCTRLFLEDYDHARSLLDQVPGRGGGSVWSSLRAAHRFARTRSGRWIEIDHIYAFVSGTEGLTARDRLSISRANRQSLLAAKQPGSGSTNRFGSVWNWTPPSLLRALLTVRRVGTGSAYAFPGDTDSHLTVPWVDFLRGRGVEVRGGTPVQSLKIGNEGVVVATSAGEEVFDIVLVTAFATDAYALLDRSSIPRFLDHRTHTHCRCFTLELDPREPVLQQSEVQIYAHAGVTTVVQPEARRSVSLAAFPRSTEFDHILSVIQDQLRLRYEPISISDRDNLQPGEAVFIGKYVDPVLLERFLGSRIYFAGSYTSNSYPLDSAEGACRSAAHAVGRITKDRPDLGFELDVSLPSPAPEPAATDQRTHPNSPPDRKAARTIWRVACTASRIMSRPVAELRFVRTGTSSWPPGSPAVYVANHRSIFDVLAGLLTFEHLGVTPRLVVKRDYFDGPLGLFLRAIGALPALRGSDATITAAIAAIEAGDSVAFMVEGRLVPPERASEAPYGRGATEVAARTGVPIVPIAGRGTKKVWAGSRPWPLFRRRKVPVTITIGEPVFGRDRQDLEDIVRDRILELEATGTRPLDLDDDRLDPTP